MRSNPAKTRTRRGRPLALVAGFCAFLAACSSYRFAAGSQLEALAAGRPVEAVAFENLTAEADAGALATRAAGRAAAALQASGSGSALRLGGVVERVDLVAAAPVFVQQVAIWHLDARVRVQLIESGTAGRVVAEALVSGGDDYRPGVDVEATEVSRRLAMARLLERLVGEGLERLQPVR